MSSVDILAVHHWSDTFLFIFATVLITFKRLFRTRKQRGEEMKDIKIPVLSRLVVRKVEINVFVAPSSIRVTTIHRYSK